MVKSYRHLRDLQLSSAIFVCRDTFSTSNILQIAPQQNSGVKHDMQAEHVRFYLGPLYARLSQRVYTYTYSTFERNVHVQYTYSTFESTFNTIRSVQCTRTVRSCSCTSVIACTKVPSYLRTYFRKYFRTLNERRYYLSMSEHMKCTMTCTVISS